MPEAEQKDFQQPDETRTFDHGKLELLKLAGGTVGRFILQPGWRWSEHVKPIAQTDLCQNNHFGYQVSGRMRARMADGSEFEVGPGQVMALPAGHDAWVVGDEPVITIDWSGASDYARR